METSEDLKKWVDSLTVAEKRYIKLIGKARAGATSQQLELFDWLNKAEPNAAIPANGKLQQNLHTVSNRLKDLILDGLRILHKEDNTDALLRTTLDEIAILYQKKLHRAVSRQLKRARRLALNTCRYGFAQQCIEWERKTISATNPGEMRELFRTLHAEEMAVLKKMEELRCLSNRHDILLSIVQQFSLHRDPQVLLEVREQAEDELVHRLSKTGAYLEKALAVNILGIRDLYERKPMAALLRYEALLREWQSHPEWQTDQTALLLQICRYYQTACFYSPVNWDEARKYISMVSGFKGLSPEARCDFQRMLYHNQFALALNTGKFDSVKTLIPEIDEWMEQEADHLSEKQVLPFLCNFAVAEFLGENFSSANKMVMRILNMPNRKVRTDIRAFALVLQAVLQHELDNDRLNEYLTRSGKRHFSKQPTELNFELAVFKHLDALTEKNGSPNNGSLDRLIAELDALAEQLKDAIPLLGLNEIRMWAQSKKQNQPLKAIFLAEVKKNLDALEQAVAV